MEQDEIERARASYERCLKNPAFIEKFYAVFMAKGPEIAERFKNTNMTRQMDTLRHGLQYMIMFASGSKIATAKIEDLGLSHDRNHRNIAPHLYDSWIESLIETVKACDPEFTEDLAMEWRNVLGHGIRRMKGMY